MVGTSATLSRPSRKRATVWRTAATLSQNSMAGF
jgi:hypothetical protein